MSRKQPQTENGRSIAAKQVSPETGFKQIIKDGSSEAGANVLGCLLDTQSKLSLRYNDAAKNKLFDAAGDGKLAQVRKMIEEKGMAVDTRNATNWTPLCYAVSNGSMGLVEYLIAKGADVNARTDQGLTPLSMAAAKNEAKIFKRLLKAGANPRTRTKQGLSPRQLSEFNSAHAVLDVLNDKIYMAQFAKKPKPAR